MTKRGPVTKLKEQLSHKEAEVAEIKSLMLHKAAEFDNARKRWQREREELRPLIKAEVLRDLCEVWDNFERALRVETDEVEKTFEAYRKGVELIFAQFSRALAEHGFKQYSCLGEEFDPVRAEAVGYVERPGIEYGQIVEELKKGFMLSGRVLRPAQVIVAREVKELDSKEETKASDTEEAADSITDIQ